MTPETAYRILATAATSSAHWTQYDTGHRAKCSYGFRTPTGRREAKSNAWAQTAYNRIGVNLADWICHLLKSTEHTPADFLEAMADFDPVHRYQQQRQRAIYARMHRVLTDRIHGSRRGRKPKADYPTRLRCAWDRLQELLTSPEANRPLPPMETPRATPPARPYQARPWEIKADTF